MGDALHARVHALARKGTRTRLGSIGRWHTRGRLPVRANIAAYYIPAGRDVARAQGALRARAGGRLCGGGMGGARTRAQSRRAFARLVPAAAPARPVALTTLSASAGAAIDHDPALERSAVAPSM